MTFDESFAPFQDFIDAHDWEGLEEAVLHAHGHVLEADTLRKIDAVDLAPYASAMEAAVAQAMRLAEKGGKAWIRFTYRTDDAWRGEFIAGESYVRMIGEDGGSEELIDLDVAPPTLPAYAELYESAKELRADRARALPPILAAHTVAVFGRAVDASAVQGIVACITEAGAGPGFPIFPEEALADEEEIPDLVTVASYPRPFEAQFAKSRLEIHGIFAVIRDEHTVAMNWLWSNAIGGVKVQVAAADADAARAILATNEESTLVEAIESDPSFLCPSCGSRNTEFLPRRDPWYRMLWGSAIVLFGLPAPPSRNQMICRDCNHVWDAQDAI